MDFNLASLTQTFLRYGTECINRIDHSKSEHLKWFTNLVSIKKKKLKVEEEVERQNDLKPESSPQVVENENVQQSDAPMKENELKGTEKENLVREEESEKEKTIKKSSKRKQNESAKQRPKKRLQKAVKEEAVKEEDMTAAVVVPDDIAAEISSNTHDLDKIEMNIVVQELEEEAPISENENVSIITESSSAPNESIIEENGKKNDQEHIEIFDIPPKEPAEANESKIDLVIRPGQVHIEDSKIEIEYQQSETDLPAKLALPSVEEKEFPKSETKKKGFRFPLLSKSKAAFQPSNELKPKESKLEKSTVSRITISQKLAADLNEIDLRDEDDFAIGEADLQDIIPSSPDYKSKTSDLSESMPLEMSKSANSENTFEKLHSEGLQESLDSDISTMTTNSSPITEKSMERNYMEASQISNEDMLSISLNKLSSTGKRLLMQSSIGIGSLSSNQEESFSHKPFETVKISDTSKLSPIEINRSSSSLSEMSQKSDLKPNPEHIFAPQKNIDEHFNAGSLSSKISDDIRTLEPTKLSLNEMKAVNAGNVTGLSNLSNSAFSFVPPKLKPLNESNNAAAKPKVRALELAKKKREEDLQREKLREEQKQLRAKMKEKAMLERQKEKSLQERQRMIQKDASQISSQKIVQPVLNQLAKPKYPQMGLHSNGFSMIPAKKDFPKYTQPVSSSIAIPEQPPDSDEECDDAPTDNTPLWARSKNLVIALKRQEIADSDMIFKLPKECNLTEMFRGHAFKARFKTRTSSAHWIN